MRLYPLRLIPDNTSINFMRSRILVFVISAILIILSLSCVLYKGLNFGIDFSGGVLMEIRLEKAPDLAKMRTILTAEHIGEISLQNFGSERDVMIRIGRKNNNSGEEEQLRNVELVKNLLQMNFGEKIEYRKVDFVGPQIGSELIRSGILAMILSFGSIMIYIWIRFEWQYGVGIIAALLHDILLTIGFMSLIGLEFNLTSIAAILTVVGYSVNDSVVIYDRIRENMRKYSKLNLQQLLNTSINDTLSRTTLTVLTTLLSTLALILFGGEVLRSFSITIFFGIVIGTISSIYISAPVLLYLGLEKYLKK
jgi:preprotein translocase subunit SecF